MLEDTAQYEISVYIINYAELSRIRKEIGV